MRGLDYQTAEKILAEIWQHTRSMGLPPLSIVMLDNGSHLKLAATQDGAGTMRYQIAHGKAATALGMGMGTRQLFELFETGVLADRFANSINGASNGQFIPQPGGLLIYREKTLLGAIGVSGASSDQDEEVAKAAIQKAGLKCI